MWEKIEEKEKGVSEIGLEREREKKARERWMKEKRKAEREHKQNNLNATKMSRKSGIS